MPSAHKPSQIKAKDLSWTEFYRSNGSEVAADQLLTAIRAEQLLIAAAELADFDWCLARLDALKNTKTSILDTVLNRMTQTGASQVREPSRCG